MRGVLVSFVFTVLALPVLQGQGIGAVAGSVSLGSYSSAALQQTNNPFTIVLEHKTVQTLADGTHITSTRHETFLRDTLGRIREETTTESMGPARITIHAINVNDMVAGKNYSWTEGTNVRDKQYFVRDIRSVSLGNVASLVRTPPPPVPSRAQISAIAQTGGSARTVPKSQTEDLGSKDIQGFSCKATRITTVYPEGYFGNDRPLTSVNEHCYSEELLRDLEATNNDPRMGVQTTTAVSITRGEPDASLFHPPSDYTARAQGGNGLGPGTP